MQINRCISKSNGRDDGIRTHDLLVPNQARYQTAPHLDDGGRGGIRTHAPLRTTAFRVQLVTASSILFHKTKPHAAHRVNFLLEQVKGIEPS